MEYHPDRTRIIGLCCGLIIAALYIVGIVSGTELRHVVQTAPLWLGVVLGFKRVRLVRWVALPMFIFWLAIVIIIWLFLLGWVRVISGHFSPAEIAMTIIIGIACVAGVAQCVRGRHLGTASAAIIAFVVAAGLQWLAFVVSFRPGIAGR